MFARCSVAGLSLVCLVLSIAGCGNPQGLDSIAISPSSQALTVGQTVQFSAAGTYGNANHPSTQNMTSAVTWSSSNPAVATVSASGLATAVGAGSTMITASAGAFNGPTSSSATVVVTPSGGGVAGGSVVSVAIIPGSQSVSVAGQTTQFLAIGTTSSGATVNLTNTNQVAWSSSSPSIATIGAGTGLATAVTKGTVTIAALYSNAGAVVTGTASFTVTGGTTQQFTAVAIIPGSESLSTLGQSSQLIALATSGSTGLLTDVTNSPQLKWSSSVPSFVSISSTGFLKDTGAGNATITAELTNSDGSVVTGTASVAASLSATPQDILSLTITPGTVTVGDLGDTAQLLAIGTFATAPTVRDLTNSVQWISTAPNVFPVTTNCGTPTNCLPPVAAPVAGSQNGGVVSAYGTGSGVIVAEYKDPLDGSMQTATANFACPLVLPNPTATPPTPGSCYAFGASGLLSTLTVYQEGLNSNTTGNWQVTAPSATGTANVLHCGPGWTGAGGQVCTATYPVGTLVVLTATQPTGTGTFGGWSVSCTPSDKNGNPIATPPTAAGPNYCVADLTGDDTVGVIFN